MSRVAGKPYFLYVLWSPSGALFYIGISQDVPYRLAQHNSGKFHGFTKRHRPWDLILIEEYPDYHSARKRENELKSQKGGMGFFKKTGLDPARFGRGS